VGVTHPELPPLGVAALASQLRRPAFCGINPGVLASAGRLLTHYVHCGAVLNSVIRLDHVLVGLEAHAESWVPGDVMPLRAPFGEAHVRSVGRWCGCQGVLGFVSSWGSVSGAWTTPRIMAEAVRAVPAGFRASSTRQGSHRWSTPPPPRAARSRAASTLFVAGAHRIRA
jgi:hypothetical protein